MNEISTIADLLGEALHALRSLNGPSTPLKDQKYLNQAEACIYAKVSKDVILRATRSGALKAKACGVKPIYLVEWLDEWIAKLPAWEPRGSR